MILDAGISTMRLLLYNLYILEVLQHCKIKSRLNLLSCAVVGTAPIIHSKPCLNPKYPVAYKETVSATLILPTSRQANLSFSKQVLKYLTGYKRLRFPQTFYCVTLEIMANVYWQVGKQASTMKCTGPLLKYPSIGIVK